MKMATGIEIIKQFPEGEEGFTLNQVASAILDCSKVLRETGYQEHNIYKYNVLGQIMLRHNWEILKQDKASQDWDKALSMMTCEDATYIKENRMHHDGTHLIIMPFINRNDPENTKIINFRAYDKRMQNICEKEKKSFLYYMFTSPWHRTAAEHNSFVESFGLEVYAGRYGPFNINHRREFENETDGLIKIIESKQKSVNPEVDIK